MTEFMKKLSEGGEGIVFTINDTEILKLFRLSFHPPTPSCPNPVKRISGFNTMEEFLENKIHLLNKAKNGNLNVPTPLSIEKSSFEETYAKSGHHDLFLERMEKLYAKNPDYAKQLEKQIIYGLRKEFIPGKPLSKNFFPSLKLKHLVQKTYKEFYNQGIVIYDERPSNYVLHPNGKLYMIDEGSIIAKEDFHFQVKDHTFGFHTYYSDKILYAYYTMETLINIKLEKKMKNKFPTHYKSQSE